MKRQRQHGTAVVEFALILPMVLMLMFTVTEFGRAMQRYDAAVKAVRDAARYMSMQQANTHQQQARNLIIYGTVDGSGKALDPNLTASMVPDPVWQVTGSDPLINTVTVRISGYQFKPMVATVFGLALPAFNFGDITATMRCPS
jgi:Flp pilus assembly protein TadG